MTFMIGQEFKKCINSLCFRKVKHGVMYCCMACNMADDRRYEIHESGPLGHSPDCNQRDVERGTISPEEAPLYY